MNPLPFTIIFLVPLTVIVGYALGGYWTYLTPIFVFFLIPAFDLLIGIRNQNLSPEQEATLREDWRFKIITWLCAPFQVGLVIWGGWVVSHAALTPLELAGLTFSVGTCSGVLGINVSHELQHRVNNWFEPLLAKIMLVSVAYAHWSIEHVSGHHRYVATPGDPATAHLGESFYAFWPRTVFGGFKSAWRLEQQRLERRKHSVWSSANRMLRFLFGELLFVVFFALLFGPAGLIFWCIQSLIAISLLEIINYVEHYGLCRQKVNESTYESVKPIHSWNSSHYLTNLFLFNLQRHSDHHYRADRRYQILRHFSESPQLPAGYGGMLLLAIFPPLWYRVMNKRAEAFNTQLQRVTEFSSEE
jgi:alkane 1-monooxygenase